MVVRWLPPHATTAFATLSLPPGQEPPITNESFLRSYLEVGVWIRCIAMQSHVIALSNALSSRLERFAASAGVYQQIGLGVEDAVATLIAWSIWTHDQSTSLADIMAQVLLQTDRRGTPYSPKEMNALKNKFFDRKRVHVDGRRYLAALVDGVEARNIPRLFGIAWKPHPSVKLVSKVEMDFWNKLPATLILHINMLTDPMTQVASACYNKLKHGPQLTVGKPKDLLRQLAYPDSELQKMPETGLLRILMDGARTEMTYEEIEKKQAVAPFLLDDADNAVRLLRQSALDSAIFMFGLGRYVYGCAFRGHKIPDWPADHGLMPLVEAAMAECLPLQLP